MAVEPAATARTAVPRASEGGSRAAPALSVRARANRVAPARRNATRTTAGRFCSSPPSALLQIVTRLPRVVNAVAILARRSLRPMRSSGPKLRARGSRTRARRDPPDAHTTAISPRGPTATSAPPKSPSRAKAASVRARPKAAPSRCRSRSWSRWGSRLVSHATAVAPSRFDAANASRAKRLVIRFEWTVRPVIVTSNALSPRCCGDVVTSSAAPRSAMKVPGWPGTSPAGRKAPPGARVASEVSQPAPPHVTPTARVRPSREMTGAPSRATFESETDQPAGRRAVRDGSGEGDGENGERDAGHPTSRRSKRTQPAAASSAPAATRIANEPGSSPSSIAEP